MDEGRILLEIDSGIATVTIDRPGKRNALAADMRPRLLTALRNADADGRTRVIVVTGAGDAFCAGGDIGVLGDLKRNRDEAGFVRLLEDGKEIIRFLRSCAKPTIAMVRGPAYGAGLFLAIGCDLRFGGESASFAAPFVKLGLGPDWGGTYLLPRMLGTAKTLEMLYSGEGIDAAEAFRIGLVNRVWPDAELRPKTWEFATRLATYPPAVLARHKQAIYTTMDGSFESTAALERELQLENFRSTDCAEGIAAFLEKRAPRFGQ